MTSKGGEVVRIGGPRRHSAAAEAEEGSAKKMRAEEAPPPTPPTTMTKKKKTKKVMRRLPQDYVDFVLAKKPKQPARFPPGSEPKLLTEEDRRRTARVNELIRANHDLIRSIQDYYRRELATKGYVEVEDEVEVSSDDDGF